MPALVNGNGFKRGARVRRKAVVQRKPVEAGNGSLFTATKQRQQFGKRRGSSGSECQRATLRLQAVRHAETMSGARGGGGCARHGHQAASTR